MKEKEILEQAFEKLFPESSFEDWWKFELGYKGRKAIQLALEQGKEVIEKCPNCGSFWKYSQPEQKQEEVSEEKIEDYLENNFTSDEKDICDHCDRLIWVGTKKVWINDLKKLIKDFLNSINRNQ